MDLLYVDCHASTGAQRRHKALYGPHGMDLISECQTLTIGYIGVFLLYVSLVDLTQRRSATLKVQVENVLMCL